MNEKLKRHLTLLSGSGIPTSPAYLAGLCNEPPGMLVTIEALGRLHNSGSMKITVIVSASPCNQHKSGNAIEYRKGLIARRGEEVVRRIERSSEVVRRTKEELKEIRDLYQQKTKELKEQR